jgi:hypothetical protein
MAFRVIGFFLTIISALPCAAVAETSFTKLVFDQCDKAIAHFQQSSGEQKTKLISNATAILTINISPPSSAEAFAPVASLNANSVPINSPVITNESWIGLQWNNIDPRRELEAKECALNLLEIAGVLALPELPDLIRIYSENPLSKELAMRFEDVTASILDAARASGFTPDTGTVHTILTHAVSSRPRLARAFLNEFRIESLPLLMTHVGVLAKGDLDLLRDLIEDISDGSPDALDVFLQQVPNLTIQDIDTLAVAMPLFPDPQNGKRANTILRLISDFKLQQPLLHLVARICIHDQRISLTNRTEQILASLPHILDTNRLQINQVRCLLKSSPSLTKRLLSELEDTIEPERERYLYRVLSADRPFPTERLSDTAYYLIQRKALAPGNLNASNALVALQSFTKFTTENANTAISILKRIGSSTHSPDYSHDIQLAALTLLNQSGKGARNPDYANTILSLLRHEDLPSSHVKLLSRLQEIPSRIWWIATSSLRTPSAKNSLRVVASRTETYRGLTSQFIRLLSLRDEAPLAAEILKAFGTSSVALLQAAYRNSDERNQAPIALILASLGTRLNDDQHSSGSVFIDALTCKDSIKWGRILRACSASKPSPIQNAASSLLRKCILTYPASITTETVRNNLVTTRILAEELRKSRGSPPTKEWFSTLLNNLAVDRESTSKYDSIASALLAIDATRVLSLIPDLHQIPAQVIPDTIDTVGNLVTSERLDTIAARWSLIEIAALQTPDTLPIDRVLDMATSELYQYGVSREIYRALRALPAELALEKLHHKLVHGTRSEIIGASLAGASYGEEAIPIVSQLWNLRLHHDPTIRDTAVLSLLAINPLAPGLSNHLKNIVGNRSYELAKTMPIDWSRTLAYREIIAIPSGKLRSSRLKLMTGQVHPRDLRKSDADRTH